HSHLLNRSNRTALLRARMAWTAVGTIFRANSVVQLQQRPGVIDDDIGVHLQSDFVNAVLAREFGCLLPIRNDFFFPLPVLYLRIFRRPTIRNPVRHGVGWAATGTSREAHDYAHS